MPIKSFSIANFFLELAWENNEPVTPMKLQKLVYYAHGWNLGLNDEPLLDELVEAWRYGPVIPSIYHEFKHFGTKPISEKAKYIDLKTLRLYDHPLPADENVLRLLQKIWEVYGKASAIKLSNMTHQPGTPWYRVYDPNGPRNQKIDNDIIKNYFREKAQG